jgi:hypothetical protein
MQIEAMRLALRPRSQWEGCDLGVRLLQSQLRSGFGCHLAVTVPWFSLCLASFPLAHWLPAVLMWWSKPWLDRVALFSMSRGLFGATTTPRDLWRAQREVLWSALLVTLTLRRASASRSFGQPVLQLEGLRGVASRVRLKQITSGHRGVARLMTQAFAAAEFSVWASLMSMQIWLAPQHGVNPLTSLFAASGAWMQALLATLSYAVAIGCVEPFYVAAGFGMYLNRRVELEAWDIEQEFRRAFA